jgi:hypothetical protein
MIKLNKIVLLLRVSGGTWPCETPATAFGRCAKSNSYVKLKDEKMCGSSSDLEELFYLQKIKKVVIL